LKALLACDEKQFQRDMAHYEKSLENYKLKELAKHNNCIKQMYPTETSLEDVKTDTPDSSDSDEEDPVVMLQQHLGLKVFMEGLCIKTA
jgi:hypothetical protein